MSSKSKEVKSKPSCYGWGRGIYVENVHVRSLRCWEQRKPNEQVLMKQFYKTYVFIVGM